MSIKNMIKNKVVKFIFFKDNELWYTTECGFEFPVPINDVGSATMLVEDKAILFMRWIKAHQATLELYEKHKVECATKECIVVDC